MKTWADFRIEIPHGSGIEVDTTCPECSSSRKNKRAKCLSVNTDKGTFHCHHCGWSGGLLQGGRKADIEHWRKPVYTKPSPKPIADDLDLSMVQYFSTRSISVNVLRRNKISLQSVYMPQLETTAKAICFPYFRDGELVNAKYRDREKNFRMESGAERILYKLADIAETTIIVEGEIDALSIEQAGYINCVSVPDGAPTPNTKNYESKFSFLDEPRLEIVKTWIIAVDNDPPGMRLEQELCRRFGIENCKRVTWPDGCKDANDVLIKYDCQKLKQCIETARDYPISGVVDFDSISRGIDVLYAEGSQTGLSTGWPTLDEYYSIAKGQVTVVTGIPNSGKSNWVDALMVNLSKHHQWSFAVFSPENQPIANHAARLIEKLAGQPFRPGITERMSKQRVDEMKEWLDIYFNFILPFDDEEWTLDHILKAAAQLVKKRGISGLVIDPWNEIEHLRPEKMSETEYISVSLKRIRQFARKHEIHVWLVAHPSKLYRDKDGKYPIPTLYDISGSAHFRNKADNGIVVWRNLSDSDEPVQIHVQKIRFREIGKLGMAKLKYLPVTAEYIEFTGPQLADNWSSQGVY